MAMQEKVKDEIAERDELRVKRAQEQLERDWRRKEADAALKKTAMTEALAEAREVQKRQKLQLRAAQAHREKMDFERVLKLVWEIILTRVIFLENLLRNGVLDSNISCYFIF